METSELKEQILYAHNLCNPFSACDVRNVLRALLADIEREDVPKPTGEQLEHGSCKGCDYASVTPNAIPCEGCVITRRVYSHWAHTPQPAQMICNHAGECKREGYCERKRPHENLPACGFTISYHPEGCPFPLAVCVPWVEPVKHYSCEGCSGLPTRGDNGLDCADVCVDWKTNLRRFYTPKEPEPAEQVTNWEYGKEGLKQQPEPAAPVIRVCEQCGAVARNSLVNICSSCSGRFVKPKEPKAEPVQDNRIAAWSTVFGLCCELGMMKMKNTEAYTGIHRVCEFIRGLAGKHMQEPKGEPGLVSYPIAHIDGRWIVVVKAGEFTYTLKTAALFYNGFHHIELKSGETATTLSKFTKNNPPVRVWFRK